jgi:endoglucanase
MKVIINTHHDKWLESRPTNQYREENNRKLSLLWTNIARAFENYDYRLAFAGTNEVHVPNNWNAPTAENQQVQNSYNQTFVNAVRATGGNNLKRHLIVQTYNCEPEFGLMKNGFVIPTDREDNGNDYMSVEFHYYKPWDYCGGGSIYYWGKNHGGRQDDEYVMTDAFQRVARAWADKGLGIVIGEWGVSDHWDKAANMNTIHASMTHFVRTLIGEARQLGFATFVWDNNGFGNGAEKFGIFDRWNGMKDKATWITKGIREGVADAIVPIHVDSSASPTSRICFEKGRIVVRRGEKVYNLQGQTLVDFCGKTLESHQKGFEN